MSFLSGCLPSRVCGEKKQARRRKTEKTKQEEDRRQRKTTGVERLGDTRDDIFSGCPATTNTPLGPPHDENSAPGSSFDNVLVSFCRCGVFPSWGQSQNRPMELLLCFRGGAFVFNTLLLIWTGAFTQSYSTSREHLDAPIHARAPAFVAAAVCTQRLLIRLGAFTQSYSNSTLREHLCVRSHSSGGGFVLDDILFISGRWYDLLYLSLSFGSTSRWLSMFWACSSRMPYPDLTWFRCCFPNTSQYWVLGCCPRINLPLSVFVWGFAPRSQKTWPSCDGTSHPAQIDGLLFV